jgi:hypothetical protein
MTMYNTPAHQTKAHFSIPSIIAIVAVIWSFFVGAGAGLILAVIAIIAGVIGLLLSLAPSIRGGVTSMVSIVLGVIGIIAAIVRFFV